ncbi:MAG: RNA ligase (ATP) [Gammaproteobacteria bacterium]|nr:RNA ligase (ATP) [Gammaproteobacteria bacterium]
MAAFESRIHALRIEPHPNADRLELAVVGGYRCVVAKGQFANGELAAYVPEGAICPRWLIAHLNLVDKLAGSNRNRVKAVRLRGVLSEGLVYPLKDGRIRGKLVHEGEDVTELLELEKYEPPVPVAMQGEAEPAHGATLRYDIENIKKHPDALRPGEPVVFTEKLHGSWCCLGWHPDYGPIVASKGLSDKALALKINPANRHNLYVSAWRHQETAFKRARAKLAPEGGPFYVLGEVYGRGVQDLHYGRPNPAFAAFDAYLGAPRRGCYLSPAAFASSIGKHFTLAPVVYRGPFSEAALQAHTEGPTALAGRHMREGVVVRPVAERQSPELGRVILKSVSADYLTRKGGTEYS